MGPWRYERFVVMHSEWLGGRRSECFRMMKGWVAVWLRKSEYPSPTLL